ncbi:restriction endonuclease subunit S [Catalinimonas sp. 4WD22]|uniref:restriction endonuclease subunit S n=1 Tax=Catalinimonas locisalis TaxID=3133978 RepID=UPI003100D21B
MQQLLAQLHTLTLNPANAERLKQLVLELAVRGKLTEQWRKENPIAGTGTQNGTEPASVLLERIQAEKAQLIKEKKIKKEKPLPPIEPNEIPYELPEDWEWCRLINICHLITDGTHHTPKYQESGIPFLSVKNISKGYLDFSDTKFISEEEHSKLIERCHPEYQDILLTKIGTTGIAKVIHTETPFSIFVSVALLKFNHEVLNPNYLELVLNSPFVKRQSDEGTEGVGNKNLVLKKIKNFLITIPPLAEQKAIVSIVDELMERIDALNEEAKVRIQTKHKLAEAALHHLTQPSAAQPGEAQPGAAQPGEDFSKRWQFVKSNFKLLFDDESTVKKLRESILQLAVQGKLTEQWRKANPVTEAGTQNGTEPASVLLERIQAEKAQLIKEKKIKKEKPLSPIDPDEIPYELPEGWEWCRLGEVIESLNNGLYKPAKFYTDKGIISLRMYNINKGRINFRDVRRVELTNEELEAYYLEANDILINRVNSAELIGKSAIIPMHNESLVYESMNMRARLVFKDRLAFYINLLLQTQYARNYMQESAKHAIGQSSVNQTIVANLFVPLPPLAEQKAIISIVDELLSLCDQLQAHAVTAKEQEEALMQALMHQVFHPKEEEREVNVVS